MSRTQIVAASVLAVAYLLVPGSRAVAQDVRWRDDYNAARREAAESGRPMLFDFGTEACFWCKKLDATTFRDPKIVKLLNERFVPVKIDASRAERLTQALGIESYPTLVLATADGKVVGRHVGYADAAQLTALLNKTPPPAAPQPQPPAKTAAVVIADPTRDDWRRTKERIDADLAALHPKIAAALDR